MMELIYKYTRAQALEDGVLVDVTDVAKEAGFKCNVAVTQSVFALIQNVPKSKYGGEPSGRLWDVLYMCFVAAKQSLPDTTELQYKLIIPHLTDRIGKDGQSHRHLYIYQKLKAIAGPDDDGLLCITIMQPHED